jgi:uracil-DNA glycosylase family 4
MAHTDNNLVLEEISKKVICCNLCPRLLSYIKQVGKTKVRRFISQDYWAKPLPGFGDSKAQLFIIGLAPAAHGGNRTGRIFTGDSSGDWVAKAMFETGFANKPTSLSKNDGLVLSGAYMTAVVKCAPPHNKPNPSEKSNCSQYLLAEVKALEETTKVILTLGKVAFDTYCKLFKIEGLAFSHGACYRVKEEGQKTLLVSYHPSRRNTSTGKLTWQMWIDIFKTARAIIMNK